MLTISVKTTAILPVEPVHEEAARIFLNGLPYPRVVLAACGPALLTYSHHRFIVSNLCLFLPTFSI
jgi:hypothetical protein